MLKHSMTWVLLIGAMSHVGSVWAEETKPTKKPGEAPTTITLDASKLPPEVLAQLLKLAAEGKKPALTAEGTKVEKPRKNEKKPGSGEAPKGALTLGIAVMQVEKSGKGSVIKAERVGDQFVLDIVQGEKKETIKIKVLEAPEGGKKGTPVPQSGKKGSPTPESTKKGTEKSSPK